MEPRAPSGLFPSSPRPTYREPHPVRLGGLLAGAGMTAAWLLLVGVLATSAASYVWITLTAAVVAWSVAVFLAVRGERGVAVGIAVVTAVGVAVAMALVIQEWATVGWPLW